MWQMQEMYMNESENESLELEKGSKKGIHGDEHYDWNYDMWGKKVERDVNKLRNDKVNQFINDGWTHGHIDTIRQVAKVLREKNIYYYPFTFKGFGMVMVDERKAKVEDIKEWLLAGKHI